MRNLLLLIVLTFFITCKTKKDAVENTTAQIIRDCTGTYIRMNEKDYKVCNEKTIENIESNTTVNLAFKSVENCPVKDDIVMCMMYHETEGFVEVIN